MIEQILSEAESLLPESHVAILAREVKRLRAVAESKAAPVAWIVGGLEGDHFTDFDKAKSIAAVYGKEPIPLYLHPQQGATVPDKVVVPAPTVRQWIKEVLDVAYSDLEPHATMRAATKWFQAHAHSIPATRVMKDGEVGVDRDEWYLLTRLSHVAREFIEGADPAQRRAAAHLVQTLAGLRKHYDRVQAKEVAP